MDRRLEVEKPARRTLSALVALALAASLLVVWADTARADTFTVENARDQGAGSLRNAINRANNQAGPDKIRFRIRGAGVQSINLASPLPEISGAVTINGYTQPGASANTLATGNDAVLKVQLNGANAGTGPDANGLVIATDDSTIKGLVINRFDSRGIVVDGFDTTGNRIEGNFIGTNAAGTGALGNEDGVDIQRADDTTVGGTAPAARNVISGNRDA
ncbi:MAG TPA: hypothetical protein VFG99_11955, partial [Chloroflexia bacterium]|nr:hypothetical protein [Chloroflexia bacterium]